MNLIAVFEDLIRDLVIGEVRKSLADTRQDGVLHSLRLLMDFLHHEMRVAVLHGSVHIPVHGHDLRINLGECLIHIVYVHFVRSQAHNFIFRYHKVLIAVRNQRSQIRGDDGACMGVGSHQRADFAQRVNRARLIIEQDAEAVGTHDQFLKLLNGL